MVACQARTASFPLLAAAFSALAASGPAAAALPEVAALQVALRAAGAYDGDVDGVAGPVTGAAVRAFQRREGLRVDGVAGRTTRVALERSTGSSLRVAALQFSLALHGFPPGPFDGRLGPRTESAVRRFQRFAGLPADGRAGPATREALSRPAAACPLALAAPVAAAPGDGFGPRGGRFHTGLDFAAPAGTPVGAAARGRVTYAGPLPGGWGLVVTVAHGSGVRTMYAHLSRVDVRVGQLVAPGARLGAVGSTGNSTGPHLHFEVRVRGAAVDPAPVLSR